MKRSKNEKKVKFSSRKETGRGKESHDVLTIVRCYITDDLAVVILRSEANTWKFASV